MPLGSYTADADNAAQPIDSVSGGFAARELRALKLKVNRFIANNQLSLESVPVTAGTGNAYTASGLPSTLVSGSIYFVRANRANTGSVTLQPGGGSTYTVTGVGGAALLANQIRNNLLLALYFDGTGLILMNPMLGITDNLSSISNETALSANQGKVLNDAIAALSAAISVNATAITGKADTNGSASEVFNVDTATAADHAIPFAQATSLSLHRDEVVGLVPELGTIGVNIDTHYRLSRGRVRDSTDTVILELSSVLTKNASIIFAEGSNNGGGGVVPTANTDFYVYIIAKTDGTTDSYVDDNKIATNLPSGFTYFRLVGVIHFNPDTIITGLYAALDSVVPAGESRLLYKNFVDNMPTDTIQLRIPSDAYDIEMTDREMNGSAVSRAMRIGTDGVYKAGATDYETVLSDDPVSVLSYFNTGGQGTGAGYDSYSQVNLRELNNSPMAPILYNNTLAASAVVRNSICRVTANNEEINSIIYGNLTASVTGTLGVFIQLRATW